MASRINFSNGIEQKEHKAFLNSLKKVCRSDAEMIAVEFLENSILLSSEIGKRKILKGPEQARIVSRPGKNAAPLDVFAHQEMLYMHRNNETMNWGTRLTLSELATQKKILEIERRFELSTVDRNGVATIEYKGMLDGKEAFRIDSLRLKRFEPSLAPAILLS